MMPVRSGFISKITKITNTKQSFICLSGRSVLAVVEALSETTGIFLFQLPDITSNIELFRGRTHGIICVLKVGRTQPPENLLAHNPVKLLPPDAIYTHSSCLKRVFGLEIGISPKLQDFGFIYERPR